MTDLDLPEHSTILVDTNLLIDYFSHKEKYRHLLTSINNLDISLTSCELVRCEFLHSKPKSIVNEKQELYTEIISGPSLPIDFKIGEVLKPIIEEYGENIEGVSTIDIFLACYLKRYPSLYLLTRNHKDFPTRIFHRSYVFSIEHERDVKTYALYQYRPKTKQVEIEEVPF